MELEKILIIARNTGGKVHWSDGVSDTGIKFTDDALVAFANAIAANEREESATVCDNRGCDCGELIRARGNK